MATVNVFTLLDSMTGLEECDISKGITSRIHGTERSIAKDNTAGVYAIVVFMIVLGMGAFLWLVSNSFLEFFFNFMRDGPVKEFFILYWANGGILVVIFITAIVSLLLYMQKSKYQQGGQMP